MLVDCKPHDGRLAGEHELQHTEPLGSGCHRLADKKVLSLDMRQEVPADPLPREGPRGDLSACSVESNKAPVERVQHHHRRLRQVVSMDKGDGHGGGLWVEEGLTVSIGGLFRRISQLYLGDIF